MTAVKWQWRERSETMWKKQLCSHQGQWRRRGRRCSKCQSRESSLAARDERPWWGRLSPCSPWRSTAEQISTCSPWKGPHAGAGGCLKEAVTPWGTHAGAACSWRTAPHGKDPRWGSLWRAAAHGKGSLWKSLWRTVSRERDLMQEQGKSVRSPPHDEQGAADTMCDELTITPIPRPSVPFRGRR